MVTYQDNTEDWFTAGKLAQKYVKYASSLIKEGKQVLDVAEHIEEKILDEGAIPAWPVNLSVNTCAAHYTPHYEDKLTFTKQDIVKCDVGVAVNGAIGDNAITVDLTGKSAALVNASLDALTNAADFLKIGISLGEIGKVIEEIITNAGFQPVRNLSGHGLDRFKVHTPPSVPNFANNSSTKLQKAQIIAIEPFATTGIGRIKDSQDPQIFEVISTKPIRDAIARDVFKELQSHGGLPYGKRWLCKKFSEAKVNYGLKQLLANNNIMAHPPLVEVSDGLVSQAEWTFLIDDDVVILTK
ncbi:type II methionyl aminopeptidase [Candidatus Woesearchaeota archaeon]|nr:type II methionyl aminopeptidase [Candidatus Woesearchaeota archaeon]